MATAKRYMLTQDMIDSMYTQNGEYKFQSGFDINGGKTICNPGLCAVITITDTWVVQTTNATAQHYLLTSGIPQGVIWNGQRPPAGPIWIDVTDTHPVADFDLDPYFGS